MSPTTLRFDNRFARDLEGLFVPWQPAPAPKPRLLHLDTALGRELGLSAEELVPETAAQTFSGNALPEGAEPIAQAYAGHQFGGFSPQLGDGRALLVGEVIDTQGHRRDIAFKGSGRTPFARGGDGKAAVGPMLREVLISEAMHALGIPTTRALAVVATGEWVMRETALPGAVLTRVAASHLRVGSFQYLAARGDTERLKRLVAHAIGRHDPDLAGHAQPALALLRRVARRQAQLIAQWMSVGFIHGVMNTDNMTVSGETIDYGPCAFLEAYDLQACFSSIDRAGRYAFGNQPSIARWNIARLAEALLPCIADDADEAVRLASPVLDEFVQAHEAAALALYRTKLGLTGPETGDAEADASLVADFLALLTAGRPDATLAWRGLASAAEGRADDWLALFGPEADPQPWLARWRERTARDGLGAAGLAQRLRAANPRIIPRNQRVEEALAAASDDDDLGPFQRLLAAVRRPFDDDPALDGFALPAPAEVTACYRTFCGT